MTGTGPSRALADAAANVAPLGGLAAGVHALLRARVMRIAPLGQSVAHLALAPLFALTWYALVIVLLALVGGLATGDYQVRGFAGPGFVWQVFQGLILYALVAALCYAIRGGRAAAPVTIVDSAPLDRYLVRDGDGMAPVDVSEIIAITGAQDYSEVVTSEGRHLVRLSLGEFEQRLDARRFLRVHRSAIINFDRLARTEPAGGGRMIAYMANGDSVPVSRAGTQLLRSFVV
jgi:DNA-binding LytR/AlgR family response regulator